MTEKKERASDRYEPEAKKVIQGRVADERPTFRRGGYTFTRAWQTLDPQPTAAVLAQLRKESAIKIREQ